MASNLSKERKGKGPSSCLMQSPAFLSEDTETHQGYVI